MNINEMTTNQIIEEMINNLTALHKHGCWQTDQDRLNALHRELNIRLDRGQIGPNVFGPDTRLPGLR